MLESFPWISFFLAISLLTISPGVDTLIVIRNSARGGVVSGVLTSFGICSGLFVHATVSAVGLSVILMSSAQLFFWLKMAGAGYLIYLGAQSLRSAWHAKGLVIAESAQAPRVSGSEAFRQGFLSNVLNPKTVVFYMAFLPQFIQPEYSAMEQSFLMAGLHFALAMIWQSLLAFTVHKAKIWLARPKVSQVLDSLTGVLLMGLGIRLATSQV